MIIKRDLIGTALVALACFLASFAWANVSSVRDLNTAIKDRTRLRDQRAQILANVNTLADQYNKHSVETNKILQIIPQKRSTAELISDIQGIIQRSGINATSINIAPGTSGDSKDEAYIKSGITLEVTGSYNDIVTLLQNIEHSLRLIDIGTLKLAADQNGQLKASITANAYSLK